MDGGESVKGTVTSLSSVFSHQEAQCAARRLEEAIAELTKELDRLLSFVEDNSGLVKLVQRLPDHLHHDIMVPFGKGAFFPGRITHTNEFMILLGEGYYADRTSKQTVEILNRRGKELDSQIKSLKAMINDLKAESSFFSDTATEAAEGLVEIREDYVEAHPTEEVSLKGHLFKNENIQTSSRDMEFSRIMAKMEELEEAELAAESESKRLLSGRELEKAEGDGFLTEHSTYGDDMKGIDFDHVEHMKINYSQNQARSPVFNDLETAERFQCEKTASELLDHGDHSEQNACDMLEIKGSSTRHVPRGETILCKDLTHGGGTNSISEKIVGAPKVNDNLPRWRSLGLGEMPPVESLQPAYDIQMAFTGSVVEHSYNLDTKPKNQAGASSEFASSLPSKPVSRFKMQRK